MKKLGVIATVIVVLAAISYVYWSELINFMMPADSRPGKIEFPVEKVTAEEYDHLAESVTSNYTGNFGHIKRFADAGILTYEGSKTCVGCHEEIEIHDALTGQFRKADLMQNLLTSAHYRFYSTKHPNVYGFNGELADDFPMGKINRPCPKPGSFAMTAWAEWVILPNGDTLSEGCGQCHIGGQYQAPLGDMMPAYRPLEVEKEAMDCLICHSAAYDMNQKQVVMDANGRKRWAQDRSMLAAMTVTRPSAVACLRCHQHNLGGDLYVDSMGAQYSQSLQNPGQEYPRIQHPGSKRGTPYTPSWDVHAAAGIDCIECHITEGHHIARGIHTTTIMANDLPGVEIACESCHEQPHAALAEHGRMYDLHTNLIACQTCHIPSLHPDNATMRDFGNPVFEEAQHLFIYQDSSKQTEPGKGIAYVWWNGDATFLGNPIGDHPNGKNLYRFYNPTHVWPEYVDFDYASWYEETMRPIAKRGRPSKLYAMKLFNGKQHIDLQNMTPFGGMFIPYNLPTYMATGDDDLATQYEMTKPMMAMMYGYMFKYYMLDKFMGFMAAESWNTGSYEDVKALVKVEPRWIPNDASLEISHAIRKTGALTCGNCHDPNGVLDWKALGYTEAEAERLREAR